MKSIRSFNSADPDDISQERALAELEGRDPGKAASDLEFSERRAARISSRGDLGWVPEARRLLATGGRSSDRTTRGQRLRYERNTAIYLCFLAGMSHRKLGRIFGLKATGIASVIKSVALRFGQTGPTPDRPR